MDILKKYITDFITSTKTQNDYITLFFYTVAIILLVKLGTHLLTTSFKKLSKNEKRIYKFSKGLELISNLFIIAAIIVVWKSFITDFMTFISFTSTAIILVLREFVYNFFSGIYIKTFKPFIVEDRIKIGEVEGDVVNINALNFELLEVSNKENGEQSTGIIVHIPNSKVFSEPLKNYVKVFKYVWNEINVKIPLDADIKKTKSFLLKIVKGNDVVKKIPTKMEEQINSSLADYRIYYNNLEPIIYTKVVDDYVNLSIRYLVHPKKARNVESEIWSQILELNKENKITLKK